MLVEQILYQLLLDHECVILPNFGGFIVRESPCNFNASKDVLKPHSKSVFFNQHLQENDGLLINAISKNKQINYNEANTILENWINNLSTSIEGDGKASVGNIGIFFKGNEGSKWFTPDSALNLSLSTYGLRPVKAGVVAQEDIREETPVIELKPMADNMPIETFQLPRTNWKAWAAAAAIAVLAHIGYLSIEHLNQSKTHQASVLPNISQPEIVKETAPAAPDSITVENTIEENNILDVPQTIVEETVTPEVKNEEAPVSSNKELPTKVKDAEIKQAEKVNEVQPEIAVQKSNDIVGKYKLEINAINHQKDLLKKGIQSQITVNENGLYEVIVSTIKTN